MYEYKARLLTRKNGRESVYDGDTIWLEVDAGFGLKVSLGACRLYGINTPEVNRRASKVAGIAARDHLRGRLAESEWFRIKTYKDHDKGKYGRYLVDVYASDGAHLNAELVETGHAVWAEY